MTMPYRADIDGLRALAVLAVVGFHAFPEYLPGGFIGVDIFFVLSGYLISFILFSELGRGHFSILHFYARRIRRIFPALILVMAAVYIFGWFALWAHEYKDLGKHLSAASIFLANLVYWKETGYFDAAAEYKPLIHLWSLGVEEQFYIVWPVLLWAASKIRRGFWLMLTISVAASFCFNLWQVIALQDLATAFFSPATRFWELGLGGLLAYYFYSAKYPYPTINKRTANLLSWSGLVLLTLGVILINKSTPFPGYWALLPVLSAIFLLAAGPQGYINKALLSQKLMVEVGLISYPLYLWHWPILSFLQIMESGTPTIELRIGALVISLLLAILTYQFIEKPIRSPSHYKTKIGLLVLGMALVGSVGLNTFARDGLGFRAGIKNYESQRDHLFYSQDFGRPENASIVLIGDSHGEHLMAGLRKIYGDQIANYSAVGCIPFEGVDRYDNRFKPGGCLKVMDDAFAYIAGNKKIEYVIMSVMGPTYLTNTEFKDTNKARITGQKVTFRGYPEITDPYQIYQQAMEQTFTKLDKLGKKVIFMIDVPELGFDPKSCMETRPFVFFSHVRTNCAVPRSEYEDRTRQYKELVMTTAKPFKNVIVIDPITVLCNDQWCWAQKDGVFFYRDADHLSNSGSELIAKLIEASSKIPSAK